MDGDRPRAYATGMPTAPTMADAVIRELWRRNAKIHQTSSRPPALLRRQIAEAKKFVLDESMSAFVADLSHAAFTRGGAKVRETMDAMRHGAMLPHPTVWIEMDGRRLSNRTCEIMIQAEREGRIPYTDPWGKRHPTTMTEVESRWGFLLWQDPQCSTVVRGIHYFSGGYDTEKALPGMSDDEVPATEENDPFANPVGFPFDFAWNCADGGFPWPIGDELLGMMMHGIHNMFTPHVAGIIDWQADVCRNRKNLIELVHMDEETRAVERKSVMPRTIPDTAGCARYMMALLATINDIPVLSRDVKASKGYVARGSYRRFVDHTVVTLSVPQRVDRQRLALRALGAARRRAHEVRGHWRLYQRGDGVLCAGSAHEFSAVDAGGHAPCRRCPAWRTWIAPHTRGDASQGIATHSYAVTHGEKEQEDAHGRGLQRGRSQSAQWPAGANH